MIKRYCIYCGSPYYVYWTLKRPPREKEPGICSIRCVGKIKEHGTLLGKDVFGHGFYGFKDYIIDIGSHNQYVYDYELFDEFIRDTAPNPIKLNVPNATKFIAHMILNTIVDGLQPKSKTLAIAHDGLFYTSSQEAKELATHEKGYFGIVCTKKRKNSLFVEYYIYENSKILDKGIFSHQLDPS